jgi:DNA-binding transcriptional MocR family regulator
MSTFINEMLEKGSLDKHIQETLIPAYSRRALALMTAIKRYLLPLGVAGPETYSIHGGYFIWLKLPTSLSAREIAKVALEEQNLLIADGELFATPGDGVPGNDLRHRLRLCFAWEKEDKLTEGVERLSLVVRKALACTEL